MGSPRRDAFEYGVLCTLGSAMAIAYGILIAYSQQRNPDGSRRKLPRVDLEASVDLGESLRELKNFVIGGGGGGGSAVSGDSKSSSSPREDDGPPSPS